MTIGDLISSLTKVTKKAFGKNFAGKQFAMKAMGKMIQATGSAGGGNDLMSGDIEGAIGSLAGTASVMTEGAGVQEVTQAAEAPKDPEESEGDEAEETTTAQPAAVATTTGTPKPVKPVDPDDTDGPASSSGQKASLKASLKPGSKTSLKGNTKEPPVSEPKESMECWVYGYTTNTEGHVRSLLLAAKAKNGAMKFSQKLALDALSDEELAVINEQLKPFRIRQPSMKSPYAGKWVKPVVKCRVVHEGLNSEERPINPAFHSLVVP